eukprot:m.673028 g.673028  ORF g.673028 m.673028 type:complete len:77 (-) comp58537_c0_seq26:675-905(-)
MPSSTFFLAPIKTGLTNESIACLAHLVYSPQLQYDRLQSYAAGLQTMVLALQRKLRDRKSELEVLMIAENGVDPLA